MLSRGNNPTLLARPLAQLSRCRCWTSGRKRSAESRPEQVDKCRRTIFSDSHRCHRSIFLIIRLQPLGVYVYLCIILSLEPCLMCLPSLAKQCSVVFDFVGRQAGQIVFVCHICKTSQARHEQKRIFLLRLIGWTNGGLRAFRK